MSLAPERERRNFSRQVTDQRSVRRWLSYVHHWKRWKTGKRYIGPPGTSKEFSTTELFRDIEEGSVGTSVVTLCPDFNVVTEEDDPVGTMLPRDGCHLVPNLANRKGTTLEFVVRHNDTRFYLPPLMRIDDTQKFVCLGSMDLVSVKSEGDEVVTKPVLLERGEHLLHRLLFRFGILTRTYSKRKENSLYWQPRVTVGPSYPIEGFLPLGLPSSNDSRKN